MLDYASFVAGWVIYHYFTGLFDVFFKDVSLKMLKPVTYHISPIISKVGLYSFIKFEKNASLIETILSKFSILSVISFTIILYVHVSLG